MKQRWNILRIGGSLALVCAAAFWAHAATVSATARQGYGRVNFGFEQPTRLKASVNGTNATLNFSTPVTQSPESIKATLPDYVNSVSLSPDKRTVYLSLSKPYRVRQFVSGNSVGVDFVGTPQQVSGESPMLTTRNEPAANAPEDLGSVAEPSSTSAPVTPVTVSREDIIAKVHSGKPVEPPKKPTATDTQKAEKSTASVPATKPAAKPDRIVPAPASHEPMLTTKPVEPPAAEPQRKPEPQPEEPSAVEPVTEPPPPAVEPVPAPPETPAPVATAPVKKGPFIVSANTKNGETTINFPWQERTAAATFKRAQDIWVVFSHAKDVNPGLLSTVMPKQIISITQYNYPGNTVLRLVTDGTVGARAEQVQGGYGWHVIIGNESTKPLLDVTISSDNLENSARLILGVFDIAPPLRFFDPAIGDEFIIAPTFENSRGVTNERNYPEFSVLASAQGVAIASRRHDLATNQTRSGFIISGAGGLSLSENLPILSGFSPVIGASATSGVMIPYDQWYVPPEKFRETELGRLQSIAAATKAARPDAMLELVHLYLSEGFGVESSGLLANIKEQYPEYYTAHKLALLHAAAHVMNGQITLANQDLLAPELIEVGEAAPWREVVALFTPPPSTAQALQANPTHSATNDSASNTPETSTEGETPETPVAASPVPKPVFHFLKYNKPYIRFYPPRIRQRLASIAAEAYIQDAQPEKALAAFDTLIPDLIHEQVKLNAEFALGAAAEKKGEFDQAYQIYGRLSKQTADRRIAANARYSAAKLNYVQGKLTGEQAAEIIELARMTWRGDALERRMLDTLVSIYTDDKRYDDLLRTQKAILDGFPNDPATLAITGEMSDLFQRIFLDGLAEEMQPLKALSLFYEFRDLTPLGAQGDAIIQRLADRLAAIDLLDRATQLLEHQIKFRVTGEDRSKVGARLALLHLLNQHPQEALNILEVTNYGGNGNELTIQRQELTAQALLKVNKNEEALGVLASDTTPQGALLRLDILWAMQDWPNVVNHAEEILAARPNLTEPLSEVETEILLKLALGYCFEGDYVQLRYLRDYYGALIPDSAYRQIFDFITNDTIPLDPEDFDMIARQISRTEGFLGTFKAKIAAGKLSEAVK